MIKKIIIILFVFSSCGINQKLVKNKDISAIIYHSECECLKRKAPKYYFEARKQINDKFDFINYETDTIFVLQSEDLESREIYESIWTKRGMVEYSHIRGENDIGTHNYMKRLYSLIENWDVETIRIEEKKHGRMIGGSTIYGMRIIIKKQKVESNCISFDGFFNPDIDIYEP